MKDYNIAVGMIGFVRICIRDSVRIRFSPTKSYMYVAAVVAEHKANIFGGVKLSNWYA